MRTLVLILCCHAISSWAVQLRVGVVGNAPLDEISVEVWNLLASNLDLSSQFSYLANLNAAKQALSKNQIDILIGAVPVTAAWAKLFNFTQPYDEGRLSLAMLDSEISVWSRLKERIARFSLPVLLILGMIFIFAALMWHLEKHQNEKHFSKEKGFGSAVWFCAETVLGASYGDIVPVTLGGRLLAILWMLISIIMISSVTGIVSAFFTVSSLSYTHEFDPRSLKNAPVAVLGDFGSTYVSSQLSAQPYQVKTLEEAFSLLEKKRVKAVVAERTQLVYGVKKASTVPVTLIELYGEELYYGFVLSNQQAWRLKSINIELLRLIEAGQIENVKSRWISLH